MLSLIGGRPGRISAADLAHAMGLHVTTVRFHLDQLEEAGLVISANEPRRRVGRPRKVYSPVASRPDPPDSGYSAMIDVLLDALDDVPTQRGEVAKRVGAAWARRHVPRDGGAHEEGGRLGLSVQRLLDVLTHAGYPRDSVTLKREPDCYRLLLSTCPVEEAARRRPEVVCSAHEGLIRGTLEQLGAPEVQVALHPMVEPNLCVAKVSPPADAGS